VRQKVLKIDAAHIADACVFIERHDKRCTGIIGPSDLMAEVKKMSGCYNAKTNQFWLMAVKTDDSLEDVFVHD